MSELLENALAAFNALSPEQQNEMMTEQRRSFAENNIALSRPAPAATDTGLEIDIEATAETIARSMSNYKNSGRLHGPTYEVAKAAAITALTCASVDTRSQAEELLAAERAEKERWHKKAMDAGVITHSDGTTSHPMRKERDDLKADNAAKDALIAQLRAASASDFDAMLKLNSRIDDLLAKLAEVERG